MTHVMLHQITRVCAVSEGLQIECRDGSTAWVFMPPDAAQAMATAYREATKPNQDAAPLTESGAAPGSVSSRRGPHEYGTDPQWIVDQIRKAEGS